MADGSNDKGVQGSRLLLIDTCGEAAGVGLALDGRLIGSRTFSGRLASVTAIAAARELLHEAGWRLAELDAVGVVNGPGSFTGVRVGMAAAMGICEGAGLRLVTVSRLAVLASVATAEETVLLLDAGGGYVYVGALSGNGILQERRMTLEDGAALARMRVLCAEPQLAESIAMLLEKRFKVRVCSLTLGHAVKPVLDAFSRPESDAQAANYIHAELEIYPRRVVAEARGLREP